jgi:hypothetical protein
MTVPTQNMTNPVTFPLFLLHVGYPFPNVSRQRERVTSNFKITVLNFGTLYLRVTNRIPDDYLINGRSMLQGY